MPELPDLINRSHKFALEALSFIAKLGTVVEEVDEAVLWLEHMRDGKIAPSEPLAETPDQKIRSSKVRRSKDP